MLGPPRGPVRLDRRVEHLGGLRVLSRRAGTPSPSPPLRIPRPGEHRRSEPVVRSGVAIGRSQHRRVATTQLACRRPGNPHHRDRYDHQVPGRRPSRSFHSAGGNSRLHGGGDCPTHGMVGFARSRQGTVQPHGVECHRGFDLPCCRHPHACLNAWSRPVLHVRAHDQGPLRVPSSAGAHLPRTVLRRTPFGVPLEAHRARCLTSVCSGRPHAGRSRTVVRSGV